MKRIEEIGRFTVRSENGKTYTVIESQEYVSALTFTGPDSEVAGLKIFRTTDGFHVKRIDPATFQIVENSEIVKRV